MARRRGAPDDDAARRLRPRRRARRGSDAHPGSLPVTRVVVYHAADCHLCARARAIVAELQRELEFDLDEVDITGVPELEARYREWLPAIEIDGRRAFTYYVQPEAFRRRLEAAQSRAPEGRL